MNIIIDLWNIISLGYRTLTPTMLVKTPSRIAQTRAPKIQNENCEMTIFGPYDSVEALYLWIIYSHPQLHISDTRSADAIAGPQKWPSHLCGCLRISDATRLVPTSQKWPTTSQKWLCICDQISAYADTPEHCLTTGLAKLLRLIWMSSETHPIPSGPQTNIPTHPKTQYELSQGFIPRQTMPKLQIVHRIELWVFKSSNFYILRQNISNQSRMNSNFAHNS